ncbi:transporter substrate-binding domain-containing protein [Undibacterium cyanobacteriorum]|uniref:Transporter substrate-binding domain-containing protein n=1 Tax=Undibacterium cyanobacteriorum TaxID=3073561 RepID=A0ABY9RNM5_9BURK|nr:transporter substrate-binding domain-containing protein [Undibacterium sp. 20NA77.5]WMW82561.1 transporter substrate-binding domain-containing protein [Undibacterium sp. 20NA77.5]
MKFPWFFCILVLSLGGPRSALADSLQQIKATQTLVVAHREAVLPLSFVSTEFKPQGYMLEVCHKVIDRIKRDWKLPQLKTSYLQVSPANRMATMMEGRAQIECGSTAVTRERQQQVLFSIPLFFNAQRILTNKQSAIKNWTDLSNRRVMVLRGSNTMTVLRESQRVALRELIFSEAASLADAAKALDAKQVDAIVADEISIAQIQNLMATSTDKVLNKTIDDRWIVTADGIGQEAIALMFNKEDSQLKTIADKEIARLMVEGELTKIYDKWFMQGLPEGRPALNLPMSFLLRDSMRVPSDKVLFLK